MEIEGLSSLQSIAGILGIQGIAALSAVMLVSIIFYACFRTGSTHLLFARLWRFLHGKPGLSSDIVSVYIDERNTLMRFRFITGIASGTLNQAEKLITWARTNDVDIAHVRAAPNYFDINSLTMKKGKSRPGRLAIFGLGGLVFISSYVMLIFTATAISSRPILTTKESGVWFLLSESTASGLFSNKKVDLSSCVSGEVDLQAELGFTSKEATAVCNLWKETQVKDFIAREVHIQRLLSIMMLGFLTWFSILTWGWLNEVGSARVLFGILAKPA